jgi:hypothetical protein
VEQGALRPSSLTVLFRYTALSKRSTGVASNCHPINPYRKSVFTNDIRFICLHMNYR